MERKEMVEVLMKKADVTYDVANEALEICNWDMLDAVIYLERKNNARTIEEPVYEINEEKTESNKEETGEGFSHLFGKLFSFIGKVIKKGNENCLVIKKENERPISISLTISILLVVLLTPLTVILLIIGLFCGYRYSLSGEKVNYDSVNTVFEEVAKATDSIKNEFNKGYNN